jgi:hypothetical protein
MIFVVEKSSSHVSNFEIFLPLLPSNMPQKGKNVFLDLTLPTIYAVVFHFSQKMSQSQHPYV